MTPPTKATWTEPELESGAPFPPRKPPEGSMHIPWPTVALCSYSLLAVGFILSVSLEVSPIQGPA